MARRGNYKFLEKFSWYTPGVGGMMILLAWLLVGAVIGSILSLILTAALGAEAGAEYGTLISYPVMFIPPMIYAGVKSASRSMDNQGVRLDSKNFAPLGGFVCALVAAVITLAGGFWTEPIVAWLPEMPEVLKQALESLTTGNFWMNLLMVSIFAPICEEWLCRGMVLRGLLASKVRAAVAIPVSALFFAFIHLNPWQAIPAFIIGCLLGYVYYKTGSLKLTMFMHFVNNTFALVCGHIDSLKDMESWRDVIPPQIYWVLVAACFLLTILCIFVFRRIPLQKAEGNLDSVPSIFDSNED